MRIEDASFFDPRQEIEFLERRLPHWDQSGTFAFITFRLIDSLPQELLSNLARERSALIAKAGLPPNPENLTIYLEKLSKRDAALLKWKLFAAWDNQLDGSQGSCVLSRCDTSKIVSDGLLKFDGDRYVMAAFAIMPNHVHLLAAFRETGMITAQGAGWRRYFARQINAIVGRTDHLWQEDQFDHLVRDEASFERIRQYIIDNPRKAKLSAGEYRLYVSSVW